MSVLFSYHIGSWYLMTRTKAFDLPLMLFRLSKMCKLWEPLKFVRALEICAKSSEVKENSSLGKWF